MSISKNIKVIREHAGLSQSDFAKLLGVSDKAVSTWENGRREPRMGVVQKIAGAFGLPISDILGSDLGEYYKTKSSPAPAEAETGEVNAEQIMKAFVAAGIMPDGVDLADEDLRFLQAIASAVAQWFA